MFLLPLLLRYILETSDLLGTVNMRISASIIAHRPFGNLTDTDIIDPDAETNTAHSALNPAIANACAKTDSANARDRVRLVSAVRPVVKSSPNAPATSVVRSMSIFTDAFKPDANVNARVAASSDPRENWLSCCVTRLCAVAKASANEDCVVVCSFISANIGIQVAVARVADSNSRAISIVRIFKAPVVIEIERISETWTVDDAVTFELLSCACVTVIARC